MLLVRMTPINMFTLCAQFETPSHLATLPTMVGEPAGGSLTSDQWMLLATVFGPLVVRVNIMICLYICN